MAYQTKYAFDLYFLLVEHVFGNLFLTWMGLALMFALIGMFARMSATTLMWFLIIFSGVFIMGVWGELGLAIVLALSGTWMMYGLLRLFKIIPN